ncbi:hypothetical protein [Candidatus Nitrosopumilus sediminis]|nr:hypothetical protein [Candidatus Nitrosopumilus sediminis]
MKTAIIADDDEYVLNMTSEILGASGIAVLALQKTERKLWNIFKG